MRATVLRVFGFVALCLVSISALAAPPTLFSNPEYESPVRGDPGDLLLLAGDGFAATDTVVYQAVSDTTAALTAPTSIPSSSNATTGVAPVVSALNVPQSLAITLPSVMTTDQSYALWVVNSSGQWSNGVLINDARPFWLTPDTAYVTAQVANLPRQIKVVGRNLQPAPGATTQVKLVGPSTYTLTAANDNNPATAIERYAAIATLPSTVVTGSYTVEVSRDGVSWLTVPQTLNVWADPSAPTTFNVASYGGGAPNDGVDDTPCIVSAIAAANSNGGGTVTFGDGVWNMSASSGSGISSWGVVVPVGVSLRGAGASSTTIRRGTPWPYTRPIFTVQGSNLVQGITFSDTYTYTDTTPGMSPLFHLGLGPGSPGPTDVSGVTFTQNVFDKPAFGIQDGGLPIDHLLVTNNVFGSFVSSLYINPPGQPIADSVVAYNTFYPGSGTQTGASQLGSGLRLDYSNNTFDGRTTATQFLQNPATDATGWRLTNNFNMSFNHEFELFSENSMTCPGDKSSDGEAMVYDNNHNVPALDSAQTVSSATATTITIPGPLANQSNGSAYPAGAFNNFFVSIAKGPGLGQVRRIVSYTGAPSGPIVLTVTPAWDVIPQSGSVASIAKEFRQIYIVDNLVDQRTASGCTKNNADRPSGGGVGFYGQTADSAIEGNRLYDTNGISAAANYTVKDTVNNYGAGTSYVQFLEIRGNTVDGEYDYDSNCSYSGVAIGYAADNTTGFPPPVEAYGISIGHNLINQADAYQDGGIAFTRGWFPGPPPGTWQGIESPLVFGNTVTNLTTPLPFHVTTPSQWGSCGAGQFGRVGIHAAASMNSPRRLRRYCPSSPE